MTQKKKKSSRKTHKPASHSPSTPHHQTDLVSFMQGVLSFMDREDDESNERGLAVDNMVESYLADLATQANSNDNNSHTHSHNQNHNHNQNHDKQLYLERLVAWLDDNEHFIEFKKGMNVINLLVMLSYMVPQDVEYDRAMRLCLMHSRQDNEFVRDMKEYYLNSLSQDEFSGIAQNEAEYQIIVARLRAFEKEYLSWAVPV